MSTVSIHLKPVAGFCIKSSTLQSTTYAPVSSQNLLGPANPSVSVPIGHKIFVNIAWDPNVPAPPAGSEDIIQRAMKGEDVDELNPDGWYVPVVVSHGRQDRDKSGITLGHTTFGLYSHPLSSRSLRRLTNHPLFQLAVAGKPSLVFDCIYNTSVKSRTLTDPEFKTFLVELALQRLEAQTSLVLSRHIGTPNIVSKGKLLPRTVSIPSLLASYSTVKRAATSAPNPLIQELASAPSPSKETSFNKRMKGILKSSSSQQHSTPSTYKPNNSRSARPTWSWAKEKDRLAIVISVPSLAPSAIAHATLDIEPRRFILNIPDLPVLDVNLELSDAEIVSLASSASSVNIHEAGPEFSNTLTLKRQRDLDVDGASAEWNIGKNILVVTA